MKAIPRAVLPVVLIFVLGIGQSVNSYATGGTTSAADASESGEGGCKKGYIGAIGLAGSAVLLGSIALAIYQHTGHEVAEEVDWVAAGVNGAFAIVFGILAFKCDVECKGTEGFDAVSCFFASNATYFAIGSVVMAVQFVMAALQEREKKKDLKSNTKANKGTSVDSALENSMDTEAKQQYELGTEKVLDDEGTQEVLDEDPNKAAQKAADLKDALKDGEHPLDLLHDMGYKLPTTFPTMPEEFGSLLQNPTKDNMKKALDMLKKKGEEEDLTDLVPGQAAIYEGGGGGGSWNRRKGGDEGSGEDDLTAFLKRMGGKKGGKKKASGKYMNFKGLGGKRIFSGAILPNRNANIFKIVHKRYHNKFRFMMDDHSVLKDE